MDIFFVYYGTAGSSGLYMDEIYNALNKNYKIMMFVNYYYPFKMSNAKKIFFKYTEKHEDNVFLKYLNGNLRKVVRIIELILGYVYILFHLIKYKPKVLNYSLINLPLSQYFIKIVKKFFPGVKIILTCHDVEPYSSTKIINYDYIYKISDFLLVHNKASENILIDKYKVNKEKIRFHDFPLMDLSKIEEPISINLRNTTKFLFIGYIREEKGVDLLIEAWESLRNFEKANLTIAGFLPSEVHIDFSQISKFTNVELIIKRLSDKEYAQLVSDSDFVILPYKQVGNSGVLSTIASFNKIVIASDLPTFKESKLISSDLLFENNNIEELCNIIKKCTKLNKDQIDYYKNEQRRELERMVSEFNDSVNLVYRTIIE